MTTQQIADRVLQWAKDSGADADLIVQQSDALSLKSQSGELDEHSVNSGFIVGVRLIRDGQVGMASSEAVDDEALKFMVDQALVNGRFSAAKAGERILPLTGTEFVEEPSLNPEDTTTIDEKIDFIVDMERELAGRDSIRNVPYNGFMDVISTQSIYSSYGRCASQTSRQVMAYVYPLASAGDLTAMAPGMMASRHFQDFDAEQIMHTAYQDSLSLLAGGPIPSRRYDVIFAINTQYELLNAFSLMWSGKSAQDQINPMRDKVGQSIFDKRLSFVDQPRAITGLAYSAFDGEGVLTDSVTLVDQGILNTLAHNSATADYFGVKNTAHAMRGPKSSLSTGLHQLHLLAGPDGDEQLHAGEYLEITQLDGLHSGTNPISGEFSCGASGFLWRNGERVSSVRGVTVAGNLYQMLQKVVAVGDKTAWTDRKTACMASIRFADVAITGN